MFLPLVVYWLKPKFATVLHAIQKGEPILYILKFHRFSG